MIRRYIAVLACNAAVGFTEVILELSMLNLAVRSFFYAVGTLFLGGVILADIQDPNRLGLHMNLVFIGGSMLSIGMGGWIGGPKPWLAKLTLIGAMIFLMGMSWMSYLNGLHIAGSSFPSFMSFLFYGLFGLAIGIPFIPNRYFPPNDEECSPAPLCRCS